jgi:hypothetical protein
MTDRNPRPIPNPPQTPPRPNPIPEFQRLKESKLPPPPPKK